MEAVGEVNGVSVARWRLALATVGVSLAILLAIYRGTGMSIVDIWIRSETFAHGFLIVPISLYLIWHRRSTLSAYTPSGNPWMLILVALAALVWAVSAKVDVLLTQQLALVTMVVAVVWGVVGTPVARAILFPLAYLFFAVPMGDVLIPPLRDFTAKFSVAVLQAFHVPVLLEGRYISIPMGTFEVAQACAGLRYLIASVVLGTVYAYLVYRSIWRRLAFVLLAIVVPIFANGLRAAGIVGLAYVSDMHLATGVDHIIYGWIFFGLVMFVLFWGGQFFRESEAVPETVPPGGSPASDPAAGMEKAHSRHIVFVAVLLVTAAALGPATRQWFDARAAAAAEKAVVSAPPAKSPWSGPFATADTWDPIFVGATGTVRGAYVWNGRKVYLYSAYYLHQRQGAELVNWRNALYDGRQWIRIGERPATVPLGDGRTMRVLETRIRSGDVNRLVWSWYAIGGHVTTDPRVAKVLEAWSDIVSGADLSSVVAVGADYDVSEQSARRTLLAFMRSMGTLRPVRLAAHGDRAAGAGTGASRAK